MGTCPRWSNDDRTGSSGLELPIDTDACQARRRCGRCRRTRGRGLRGRRAGSAGRCRRARRADRLLEPPSCRNNPTDPASTDRGDADGGQQCVLHQIPLPQTGRVECRSEPVATWKRSPGRRSATRENRCAATDVEAHPAYHSSDGYAGLWTGTYPAVPLSPPPPRA